MLSFSLTIVKVIPLPGFLPVIQLKSLGTGPVFETSIVEPSSKFFNTLRELGLSLIEHSFPDHYQFKEEDLDFEGNQPIVMTEKDAVRCVDIENKNLWYLSIEANIEDEIFEKKLLSKIKGIEVKQ